MNDIDLLLSQMNDSPLVYGPDGELAARQVSASLFDDIWDFIARGGKRD